MKTLNNWTEFVNESKVSEIRTKLMTDYEKIAKTIKSLDKESQIETTENMIDAFSKIYIHINDEAWSKGAFCGRSMQNEIFDIKERVKELKSEHKKRSKELKKEDK